MKIKAMAISSVLLATPWLLRAQNVTYNGIVDPAVWPPQMQLADFLRNLQDYRPSYLISPPAVIPIDVGRQLLVDDFLVASTNLTREFHAAIDYPNNPVLTYDRAWEQSGQYGGTWAAPFSDGVWFDPLVGRFRMWYRSGTFRFTALAESDDGITWEKPDWGLVAGTNIVWPAPPTPVTYAQLQSEGLYPIDRDSSTVWIRPEAADPNRKYVMAKVKAGIANGTLDTAQGLFLYYSPDGVHWTEDQQISATPFVNDRITLFFNPFRREWVFSVRVYQQVDNAPLPNFVRSRFYFPKPEEAIAPPYWDGDHPTKGSFPIWWMADGRDVPYYTQPHHVVEFYDLDATPYESIMVGLMAIFRGRTNFPTGRPKINEIYLGFSRDGFHFTRDPNRSQAFISVDDTPTSWKWGNVQPVGGGFIVGRDWLWFYYSGSKGLADPLATTTDGGTSTGLAYLRRDGFASLNAGAVEGAMLTRTITFSGNYLFVNAEVPAGQLYAEICDVAGNPLAGFTKADCIPFQGDSTIKRISWRNSDGLGIIAGQNVKIRFYLASGKLYSFWVSPSLDGRSLGYLAAGSPGTGLLDDSGSSAKFNSYSQYRFWRYSPLEAGNEAISGPNTLDLADGKSNLSHYLDFPQGNGRPFIPVTGSLGDDAIWHLSWVRPAGRNDLSWKLMWSPDLLNWQALSLPGTPGVVSNGDGTETVSLEFPQADFPFGPDAPRRIFFKLAASL